MPPQLAAGSPNWLDCYLTVLKPLPLPTSGLLGSTYKPAPAVAGAVARAAPGPAAMAALVFEEA